MGYDLISDETGEYLFTCECGSHALRVERCYTVTTDYTTSATCDCGEAEDGVAWVLRQRHCRDLKEIGYLDSDHRVDHEDTEELDEDREDLDEETFCFDCREEAEEDETEIEEGETEHSEHDVFVKCAGCGREIEFGYSHPDSGRIWPSEGTDFNPWKSWPELRYRESWKKKGWLRPGSY